jgi:hypothetical protein
MPRDRSRHHHGIGELAAQRLDLDAVSDGLKVAHQLFSLACVAVSARLAVSRSAFPSPAERQRYLD